MTLNDLIDTTEMYLRTVFELEEEGIVPMRARIAERLGQSGPTVSQTVARMERDGLLTLGSERQIQLSDTGRARAVAVMRKHRLAERLLTDVIGLEWDQVHVEACRWEHVMSEQVERRLMTLLGDPTESPYGNPIPGLDALGVPEASEMGEKLVAADVAGRLGGRFEIRRIIEVVQNTPEAIAAMHAGGVRPGAIADIRTVGEVTVFDVDGVSTELDSQLAYGIRVRPVNQ